MKAGKFLWEMENFSKNFLSIKKHELLGSSSIYASLIKGGKELSTYPDYCEIKLERRTIPGESYDEVIKEMDEIFKSVSKDDMNFRGKFEIFFSAPLEISQKEEIVKSLSSGYKFLTGDEPQYAGLSFWTDGAILAEHGIPSVVFGPSGSGMHSSVEYVNFKSAIIFSEVLTYTVVKFCGE